jgi:hypothetical protein
MEAAQRSPHEDTSSKFVESVPCLVEIFCSRLAIHSLFMAISHQTTLIEYRVSRLQAVTKQVYC